MLRIRARTLTACAAVLFTLLVAGGAAATLGSIGELQVPPPGGPNSITLSPDGALWFTELSRPAIGRVTTAGNFTSFSITSNATPISIVAGPDGALWFTESSGPGIGRITTAGKITEFAVPACGPCRYPPGPLGLTVGSDGALWYARPSNNTLGRVTTDGHVSEIKVPGGQAEPRWITKGPDGALWFTDETGVARMGSDGSVAQVWSGLNYPSAITTGPDGKLWPTGSSQDVVARVSSAGQGSYFSLDLNCDPQWIAPGAGSLWIPCYNLNEIERVSTAGALNRVRVPAHFQGYPDTLAGIVQGPDSAMWFTEYSASRLGRLSLR
jgi:virginiamycin B lyase